MKAKTNFLKSSTPWMKKPKEEEKNVKNATRIIMYCKTKKIFVLFHVQNEKFREKNTIMLFYFNPHPNSTPESFQIWYSKISTFLLISTFTSCSDISWELKWLVYGEEKRVHHEDVTNHNSCAIIATFISQKSLRWKFTLSRSRWNIPQNRYLKNFHKTNAKTWNFRRETRALWALKGWFSSDFSLSLFLSGKQRKDFHFWEESFLLNIIFKLFLNTHFKW